MLNWIRNGCWPGGRGGCVQLVGFEITTQQPGTEVQGWTFEIYEPAAIGNGIGDACDCSDGISDGREIQPWVQALLKKGHRIWRVRGFASGLSSIPLKVYDSWSWSPAYNRDNRLNAIQDIVTALTFITSTYPQRPLTVAGFGASGLTTAFASAVFGRADKVVADLNGADPGYDRELLSIFPEAGIKRVGDLRTAALLLMQKQLVLCNPGATFDMGWYEKMGKTMGMEGKFMMKNSITTEAIPELF